MIRAGLGLLLVLQLALLAACGGDRLPAFADPPDAGLEDGGQ